MAAIDELLARGEIGGRTIQIESAGTVGCVTYEPARLAPDAVRIRTVRSAVSPGTEATYLGRDASNVHLVKRWNNELRLFEPGVPSVSYPMPFGYRAAGVVVESSSDNRLIGARVWGNWRHTELTSMPASQAAAQLMPDEMEWSDGVDIGQMGPICINAVEFGAREQVGRAAVVFGAGPVGLITAQAARISGASPVVVVDRLVSRLEIAAGLGLDVLEASAETDVAASLKRRFGVDGVPVAWECAGALRALHEAIRTVARKGRVVAVGFYQGGATQLLLGEEFHHNGVHVVSGQIGNPFGTLTRRDLQMRTLELVLDGRLTLGGLPRLLLAVGEAAAGYQALKRPDEVLQVEFSYDDS